MFELVPEQTSESIRKLDGSTSLMRTILSSIVKDSQKKIGNTRFTARGKNSDLDAIWLNAEMGTDTIQNNNGVLNIVNNRDLASGIDITITSQNSGTITVKSKLGESLNKGGSVVIKRTNPKFEDNLRKLVKNKDTSKKVISLSQISIVLPEGNPLISDDLSKVSMIVKDFLEG